MKQSVFSLKDYEVHSITTAHDSKTNANIATWVMQSAMKGKFLAIALYKPDFTITLVKESSILNVNLLSMEQAKLVARLGRKSGRDTNKLLRIPHQFDARGCPFLTEAVGYIQCHVHDKADSGDHEIFVCEVLAQQVLHPDRNVLTYHYLKENGLSR
jgi:flavin reductase (DIM6/NTAB) family NADH-FMN oxidoreductase RutF